MLLHAQPWFLEEFDEQRGKLVGGTCTVRNRAMTSPCGGSCHVDLARLIAFQNDIQDALLIEIFTSKLLTARLCKAVLYKDSISLCHALDVWPPFGVASYEPLFCRLVLCICLLLV